MNGRESITGEAEELLPRADSLSAAASVTIENVPSENDDPFTEPERLPNENAAVYIDELDKSILSRPHAEGRDMRTVGSSVLQEVNLDFLEGDQSYHGDLLNATLNELKAYRAREDEMAAREARLKCNETIAENFLQSLREWSAKLMADRNKVAEFLKKYGEIEEGMTDILRKVDDDAKISGDVLLCEYEEDL